MTDEQDTSANPTGASSSGGQEALQLSAEEMALLKTKMDRRKRRRKWFFWTLVVIFMIGLFTSVDAIMNTTSNRISPVSIVYAFTINQ